MCGECKCVKTFMEMNTPEKETNDVHLVGHLDGMSYARLCEIFGEPTETKDEHRGHGLWRGRINGLPFTIYDWRMNTSVDFGIDVHLNMSWSIGGHEEVVAELIQSRANYCKRRS